MLLGNMETLIGTSEGGLSVPNLDIKQPTPSGARSPTSSRSSLNKEPKQRYSAGKRGEMLSLGTSLVAQLLPFVKMITPL